MSTIVTRAGKGSPLTHTEVDSNFTNLNTDKAESTNPTLSGNVSTTGLNFDSNTLVIDATNNRVVVNNATSLSAGRISALLDASAENGVVLRDSATSYANNNNFVLLQNSSGNTVGSLTHPAASSLGVWGVDDIRFITALAAAERMRITSTGNVGIGTSSPVEKLEVLGNIVGRSTKTSSTISESRYMGGAYTGNLFTLAYGYGDSTTNRLLLGGGTSTGEPATYIGFYTGTVGSTGAGTERMRITSTGNVGIGTSSPVGKLQIAQTNNTTINGGSYLNLGKSENGVGGYHLIGMGYNAGSNYAPAYMGYVETANNAGTAGDLVFFTRPSGNADTVAPTERMRIDSSGNLGLGVTPSAWYSTGYSALQVKGSSLYGAAGNDTNLASNAFVNTSPAWAYVTTGTASRYEQGSGIHKWYNAPSGTAGNAITFTQAMTLDASGNLGVGTTSPVAKIDVSGTIRSISNVTPASGAGLEIVYDAPSSTGYITSYNRTASTWSGLEINSSLTKFSTGGTERMRIDSSGNLLVGITSAGGNGLTIYPSTFSTAQLYFNRASGTGTSYPCDFRNGGTNVGAIAYTNTTTSFITSSDYRLKENIAPMTGALAKVSALKPCTYTWKADGSNGEGFIAHELAEVVPQAVTGEKDAVNEDGSIKSQGIDTSFLVATLTAAIQEQQAIITDLKARIETLESK